MSYKGSRQSPYLCNVASQLEDARLVTITKSTMTAAYATYGSVVEGVTRDKGTALLQAVYPLNMSRTHLVKLLSAVSAGDVLFPATDGKAVGSSHTCISRGQHAEDESSPSEGDIYLLTSAATGTNWSGHDNAVATYASAAWTFVDVDSTTNLGLTVYVSDEKKYYTWNGTAWVLAKSFGIAEEAGAIGAEIAFYNVKDAGRPAPDALPANLNYGAVLMLQYAADPNAASFTILDSRIVAGDTVLATVNGGTSSVYIIKAVATTGTITVTLSADPTTSITVNCAVIRQL